MIMPGITVFTVIPVPASAFDSPIDMLIIAALDGP